MTWTHYTIASEGAKMAHIFCVSTCEACGCEIEAANAVSAVRDANFARICKQMTKTAGRLPAGGYSDGFGGEVCMDCYAKYDGEG